MLSSDSSRQSAWSALQQSRNRTDRDLAKIPHNLLSSALLSATRTQLNRSRKYVDFYRDNPVRDAQQEQQAIDEMVKATSFYHEALFRRTSTFLKLESSGLGPILRAQALGELRDLSGRLGSQLLIPLATKAPLSSKNNEILNRDLERIRMQWWLLETHGKEESYLSGFRSLLADTHTQFQQQGIGLINTLQTESRESLPYSVSAENFAIRYHASLGSFDNLLHDYMVGIKMYYSKTEKMAFRQLISVSVILFILSILVIVLIAYIRRRVLKPVLQLNKVATAIIDGYERDTVMTPNAAEEVKLLSTSLEALGTQLRIQVHMSQQFQRQSEEDPLTHLLNRRAFEHQAEILLQQQCEQNIPWLVIMDVDHFKSVNDTWGHPTGDQVLIGLASVLKVCSRAEDITARLGGEEFAIMFHAPDHKEAERYVRHIQKVIRSRTFQEPRGETFSITASFGMTSGWKKTLKVILAEADAALYQAKRSGRDRLC